jgi:hypothetical protein
MLTIRSTAAHYIRCMKPNPVNEPGWIHRQTVVDQLRYGGVLEAVRVSRVGCVTAGRWLEARAQPATQAVFSPTAGVVGVGLGWVGWGRLCVLHSPSRWCALSVMGGLGFACRPTHHARVCVVCALGAHDAACTWQVPRDHALRHVPGPLPPLRARR